MKDVKLPRNKYLSDESKKLLDEYFPFNEIEEMAKVFTGKELTDENLEVLLDRIVHSSLKTTSNILGDPKLLTADGKKVLKESLEKIMRNSPEIRRILRENHIRTDRKISAKKLKDIFDKEKIRELAAKNENITFGKKILENARENLYKSITMEDKIIEEKVKMIYDICRKSYTPETVEQVNIIYGSELYNRIISIVQKSQSILRDLMKIKEGSDTVDRDYLVSLTEGYAHIYNETEILVKLLYAIILASEGGKIKVISILNGPVGRFINIINRKHPGLIEYVPTIRNSTHSAGITFKDHDEFVQFIDRSKKIVLSRDEFIEASEKLANTAIALLSLTNIQFMIAFDIALEKMDKVQPSS